MSLATMESTHSAGYKINLGFCEEGALDSNKGYGEALRIILVEEGSGIIRIGGRRHVFTAPVVFCFNELDMFRFENIGNCRARTIWFHPEIINITFDFDLLRPNNNETACAGMKDVYRPAPFCRNQEDFTGQLNIGADTSKRIGKLFDSIKKQLAMQSDYYWSCRSRSYLIELLLLLSEIRAQKQSKEYILLGRENDETEDVIQYLHANYCGRITLTQLTRRFHINRTSLGRDFLEATGMTIMNYLMRLRLYIASQLLKDTTLPINEIYERVGFNDPAHFGRQFRKYYSISPSGFRSQNNRKKAI